MTWSLAFVLLAVQFVSGTSSEATSAPSVFPTFNGDVLRNLVTKSPAQQPEPISDTVIACVAIGAVAVVAIVVGLLIERERSAFGAQVAGDDGQDNRHESGHSWHKRRWSMRIRQSLPGVGSIRLPWKSPFRTRPSDAQHVFKSSFSSNPVLRFPALDRDSDLEFGMDNPAAKVGNEAVIPTVPPAFTEENSFVQALNDDVGVEGDASGGGGAVIHSGRRKASKPARRSILESVGASRTRITSSIRAAWLQGSATWNRSKSFGAV
jgi:hypothetical protein